MCIKCITFIFYFDVHALTFERYDRSVLLPLLGLGMAKRLKSLQLHGADIPT